MKYSLYILFTFLLIASSCRQDEEQTDIVIIRTGENVETNLHGRVVTESGRSVRDTKVTITGKNNSQVLTTTDGDGYYYLPNITIPSDGFIIETDHPAYKRSLQRIVPQAGKSTINEVVIQGDSLSQDIESEQGFFMVEDNLTISFPNNSLVTSSGAIFSGSYSVSVSYYDPTDPSTMIKMPGNMEGINKSGDRVTLGSYGMFDIQVTSTNGEALQLADDATASVTITVPNSLFANALETVPLWRLDENSGQWLEDSDINFLQDADIGFFIFDIDEFTFWNVDIAVLNVTMEGKLVDDRDIPIENRLIYFSFEDDGNTFLSPGGYTNSEGEYICKVPRGKDLILNIYGPNCNDAIASTEVGMYSENVSGLEFELEITEETFLITGIAFGCNEVPLDNATVFLYDENDLVRATTQTRADGSFSIHSVCYSDVFSIKVLDLESMEENISLSDFPGDDVFDLGIIDACASVASYINVTTSFGDIIFENPSVIFEPDSLLIYGENNLGTFSLFADINPDGNNVLNELSISYSPNTTLTCTNQFQHTLCSEAITLTIDEINDDQKFIAGSMEGILFTGEIIEPKLTEKVEVSINFNVQF